MFKSKLSSQELVSRRDAVLSIQNEIHDIREMQRAGFVKGYQPAQIIKMEDSELFKPKAVEDGNSKAASANREQRNANNIISDGHKLALVQIKARDRLIVRNKQRLFVESL